MPIPTLTAAVAATIKQSSAAPLWAGILASGSVLTEAQTGVAVLMILGGGAFLLSIWVNILKARSYMKGDRTVEAKAQAAEMASRAEMEKKFGEVWTAIQHMRETVTKDLAALTKDIGESTADMQNALGRLQGLYEAGQKRTPR